MPPCKPTIQQLLEGMGDQVDNFESAISSVKWPKRAGSSDNKKPTEEGERRRQRSVLGANGISEYTCHRYVVQMLMSHSLNTKVPTLPSLLQNARVAHPAGDCHQLDPTSDTMWYFVSIARYGFMFNIILIPHRCMA